MTSKNNNGILMLTHILGLFTGFIGALIVLLITEDAEVKKHAKEALNWQISLIIYLVISVILVFVLIGILFLIALGIMNTVVCIIAAVKASEGKAWNYPMTIRFLK